MITLPNKPKIIEENDNHAVFEVDSCYPGYGITLGNAVRRVLLSSLPGAAVVGIKVKNVSHEFSTIPYVMEDVVQIILNLKQVRFMVYGDYQPDRTFSASLKIKGEKEAKAGDIKTSSDLEIINKEAPIAVLTDKKAELDIEIEVGMGLGYSAVEQRKQGKQETGKIAIDAIFTPVKKVNYSIEHMRVGDRTDYDKVTFVIDTDGTVSPRDAFLKAIGTLIDHYQVLAQLGKKEAKTKKETKEKTVKTEIKKQGSSRSDRAKLKEASAQTKIDELKISSRTKTVLEQAGIKTVAGLARKSRENLAEVEGLGEKGMTEIRRALGKLGLTLKQ